MNISDYTAALRAKYPEVTTTYKLAKLLNVSHTTATRYDRGTGTFDATVSKHVADLLGLHPGIVLLDMEIARAQTPETRSLWSEIYKGFRKPLPHAKSGRGLALAR